MKNTALIVAGLIFLIVATAHFLRYHQAIPVVVNGFSIPLDWSLYSGVVSVLLALWMFIATRK